jgi:hypothetical protein
MKRANLTKVLWVYNEVKSGDIVKDNDGQVFTVTDVLRIPSPAIQGRYLEVL